MDQAAFDTLISRLERRARERPAFYAATVAAVALLGFLILGATLGFSALLLAAFAGLVILAAKFGGGGVAVLILKLGKAMVLLLVPAWMMLKSTWTMLTTRFPAPTGRELSRTEAPALFARLDDMRARMQGPRFHHVLLTDEMNAAVVQHPRWGLLGGHRNYLILGLPLLTVMSADEAMAVVAHEYGHLSGQHSRFGAFIYRLRSAWARLQAMAGAWTDWGSRLVARLFHWYAPFFNAYTFVLARQNEYVADRAAADLVGVAPMASALARINIASHFEGRLFWPAVNRRVRDEPQPPTARSADWAKAWREELQPAQQEEFLREALTQVTDHSDTHPALVDRLRALGIDAATVLPPTPVTESAANAWLGERLASLQQELDREWCAQVGPQWQERHVYLQQRLQRLTELRALPAPDGEESWELIAIIGELEPGTDLLPLLDELITRLPRHASALYRRGDLRLDRGDEGGIADLELVMEIDPDATVPACNLIWGFLVQRDDARAETYHQRWLARQDFEARRRHELDHLDPAQTMLAPPGLDDAVHEGFAALLRARPKGIKRAWLLRREIASDPEARAYVLAIETTAFTSADAARKIVEHLAAQTVPVPVHIVPLSSAAFAKLRKQVKQLNLPPLYP